MSADEDRGPLTSIHVKRAVGGDQQSLEWVITRFTPFLLSQAEYRLGGLRLSVDPQDVVSEVWLVALNRLKDLRPRDERFTPVLMKFLSTTLLYRVNNLIHKHLSTSKRQRSAPRDTVGEEHLSWFQAETGEVVNGIVEKESQGVVLKALKSMEDEDREIIVLRVIEQMQNQEAADVLGLKANTAAVRFRRALEKLREKVPASALEDLADS